MTLPVGTWLLALRDLPDSPQPHLPHYRLADGRIVSLEKPLNPNQAQPLTDHEALTALTAYRTLEQALHEDWGLTLDSISHHYLSYQAVTDTVAACLFPAQASSQIDARTYQEILETADSLCRELGYQDVTRLTPPDVAFDQMGLYWIRTSQTAPANTEDTEDFHIIHGPGRMEMLQSGQLHDVRLHQWGLNEVTRQHFKIPVLASDSVLALMERAVASAWPNDYKGLWHDLLGMCIIGGRDNGRHERHFTVIIRGMERRYWRFKAQLRRDEVEAIFLIYRTG